MLSTAAQISPELIKPCTGRLACRAAYRLAHYADGLYRRVVATRQSPEWATTQAIIRHKRHEVRAAVHHFTLSVRVIRLWLGAPRQSHEWAAMRAIIRHGRHEVRAAVHYG